MNISTFPNPRLNLPLGLIDPKDENEVLTIRSIEEYIQLVGGYIYTNIKIDYLRSDSRHAHAWLQTIISAHLLRSLYIRNLFVDLFNKRDTVGVFFPLKAWFEIVGFMASILEILERNLSSDELYAQLAPYALGNVYKGDFKIGNFTAKRVAGMIKAADTYLGRLDKDADDPSERFFTSFYDHASNPTHPCSRAADLVGETENGLWKARNQDEIESEGRIISLFPTYGGLLMSALSIKNICHKISLIENAHFSTLGSRKYFG